MKINMTKNINLDELVDVCAGRMNLKRLHREISHYMTKTSEKLIIVIERKDKFITSCSLNDKMKEYNTTLYITKNDFYNKC